MSCLYMYTIELNLTFLYRVASIDYVTSIILTGIMIDDDDCNNA